MANPERGTLPQTEGTGAWVGINIEVPETVIDIQESIEGIAQILLAILSIVASMLNIAKAFALSFLDPLSALIEALVTILEDALRDIQEIGIYFHGDFYILKEGPEMRNLLGGYSAYERRMVSRIIDPRDPNRPDVSSGTLVVGMFFYLSSGDASGLMKVINFIAAFLKLFNQSETSRFRSLGTVTDVRVSYGYDGGEGITERGVNRTLFEAVVERSESKPGKLSRDVEGLKGTSAPNVVNLEWFLAASPGNFVSPVAPIPPSGFFIEISTESAPLSVQYDNTPVGLQTVEPVSGNDPKFASNRVRGLVVDEHGNALQVTGGSEQFLLLGKQFFRDNDEDPRAFFFQNTGTAVAIPLNGLLGSGVNYLQKTIYVPLSTSGVGGSGGFKASLKLTDMPLKATFDKNGNVSESEETDTFYIRIRPVSDNVSNERDLQYRVSMDQFTVGKVPVVFPIATPNDSKKEVSILDRGELSAPVRITFPNANTDAYLRCVLTALIVLGLSRPDLILATDDDGDFLVEGDDEWGDMAGKARQVTGLEDLAALYLPQLTGSLNSERFYGKEGNISFRRTLYYRCAALTDKLYRQNNPSPATQKLVADRCKNLLEFTLGDFVDDTKEAIAREEFKKEVRTGPLIDASTLTLIQAMLNEHEFFGIAKNTSSVGTEDEQRTITKDLFEKDLASGAIKPFWRPQLYETTNKGQIEEIEEEEIAENTDALTQNQDEDESNVVTNSDILSDPDRLYSPTQMIEESKNKLVKGSVENMPVIYTRRGFRITKITLCRNAFDINEDPEKSLYVTAAFALQVAAGPQTSFGGDGWIALRLDMGLPPLAIFLDEILAWIRAISSAGDAIGKTLRQYIDFAQARIFEMQALIRRISSLLQSLVSIFGNVPSGLILPVVAQGTDGLLQSFITATNKPDDGPSAYSGGAVIVGTAPNFPLLLVDIFKNEG